MEKTKLFGRRVVKMRTAIILLVPAFMVFTNNCSTANQGFATLTNFVQSSTSLSSGGDLSVNISGMTIPPILANFTCTSSDDPAATPLKRLSKRQYTQSMINLTNMGGYESAISSDAHSNLVSSYAMLPEDSRTISGTGITTAINGFDRTDSIVSQAHSDAYFMIATSTADYIIANNRLPQLLIAAGGYLTNGASNPCDGTLPASDACVAAFINGMGFRAFRRPVKPDELASYQALYATVLPLSQNDAFAALITRFMMSPPFLYFLEIEGTPVNGREDLLTLTPYELATRLTYAFQNDIPDATLMKAAQNGSLLTDAYFATEIQTLLRGTTDLRNYQNVLHDGSIGDGESTLSNYQWNYKSGEVTLEGFFTQWLKIPDISPFDYTDIDLAALADKDGPTYLTAGPTEHHVHYTDMLDEVVQLTNYYLWTARGTYADLMTTNKLAYQSSDVELILKQTPWAPNGDPAWRDSTVPMPSYPAGERDGILNRAIFATSSNESTNPVRRGVFVQRQILCDSLPSPDPNALPDRSLDTPDADPSLTTRERYTEKTASATCQACHSQINPVGFAFEDFDSIGRVRAKEFIFDANGNFLASPAINAATTVSLGATAVSVTGGSQMAHALASSERANQCFVRQAFRFMSERTETTGDGCTLNAMYQASTGQSMLDMFQKYANTPAFRLHKVGPQ